jgi:hypothetical protein
MSATDAIGKPLFMNSKVVRRGGGCWFCYCAHHAHCFNPWCCIYQLFIKKNHECRHGARATLERAADTLRLQLVRIAAAARAQRRRRRRLALVLAEQVVKEGQAAPP